MSGQRKILDRGKIIDSKICEVCNRRFTWRKKWERCWGTIKTCSNRCKTEKKRSNRQTRKHDKNDGNPFDKDVVVTKESRREQKKRLKAARRAERRGEIDASSSHKKRTTCDVDAHNDRDEKATAVGYSRKQSKSTAFWGPRKTPISAKIKRKILKEKKKKKQDRLRASRWKDAGKSVQKTEEIAVSGEPGTNV